jgi:hypothetical protein
VGTVTQPPSSSADTQTADPRCTAGCTSKAKTDNAGTVEALAAALLGLSPEDRARLAAMLLGQQADGAKVNPATPDAAAGR